MIRDRLLKDKQRAVELLKLLMLTVSMGWRISKLR